jgi:hypothetical protein
VGGTETIVGDGLAVCRPSAFGDATGVGVAAPTADVGTRVGSGEAAAGVGLDVKKESRP